MSLRDVGDRIGVSYPTISRWETGDRVPRPEDVSAILVAVGATPRHREQLIDLTRSVDKEHWLSLRAEDRDLRMLAYLEHERAARRIIEVQPLLLPGLLQTAAYARAIMLAGGLPSDEAEARVQARIARHDALTRPTPIELLALIGEASLHQEVGGLLTMLEQMKHLAALMERINIDIRIVPNSAGWTPMMIGGFVLLEDQDGNSVAHLENRHSVAFLHKSSDVDAYREDVLKLVTAALSTDDSARYIAHRITELAAH